ncbi:MAG: hypothetical protein RBQ97_00330 [Acholeplasma sp.]|nr:hypothetical protein [Acholeplasma sp.]
MTLDQILTINFFNRVFENEISKYADSLEEKGINDLVKKIDKLTDLKAKFVSAFVAFTYYRHNDNYCAMDDIVTKYDDVFKYSDFEDVKDLWIHIKLLNDGKKKYDESRMFEQLKTARILKERKEFKDHTGIMHHYAEMVAKFYELQSDLESESAKNKDEYIHDALKTVNECIALEDNYSKFHATKGRLLLLQERFLDAYRKFEDAILLLDPKRPHFSQDLLRYQSYQTTSRVMLQQVRHSKKNEEQIEKINQELRQDSTKILGVFTGFVSLILGNLQIIAQVGNPLSTLFIFNGVFFIFFGVILFFLSQIIFHKKMPKLQIWLASIMIFVGTFVLITFYIFPSWYK